jgi:hypothetical protein
MHLEWIRPSSLDTFDSEEGTDQGKVSATAATAPMRRHRVTDSGLISHSPADEVTRDLTIL